jgi:hypothetical protein
MRLSNVRLRVTAAVTPHNAGTAAWANRTLTPHVLHADATAPACCAYAATPTCGAHVAASASGARVIAPASSTIQVAGSGPDAGDSIATEDFDPWTHRDVVGVAIPQTIPRTRTDGNRLTRVGNCTMRQVRYVPSGRTATMPDGDAMKSGDTVPDIRSRNEGDPRRPTVQAHLDGGAAASSTYHRFWVRPGLATAHADYRMLFPAG